MACIERPSTTHCTVAGGLELAVSHLKLSVSLTLAVSGPSMVTLSGATEKGKKSQTLADVLASNCSDSLMSF